MSDTATDQVKETVDPRVKVRPFHPSDRAIVRKICADTGFLGKPVDPVFEDRELFADYLTNYYLRHEPDCCFILEMDGVVKGYLMGARHRSRQRRFDRWHNLVLAAKGFWRYFTRPYNAETRRYVKWILTRASGQTPSAPEELPHFHINLLPEARRVATSRALFDTFFTHLHALGEKGVYGQMVTFETRRGERFFERFGFHLLDRKKVTKFDHVSKEQVYLCTVVKRFDEGVGVYDRVTAAQEETAP